MSEPLEYLIIISMGAGEGKDVEGYYLLDDTAMGMADAADDYWAFFSHESIWIDDTRLAVPGEEEGLVRRFRTVNDLCAFMAAEKIVLVGEWVDVAY
jgi:hypothetical protein